MTRLSQRIHDLDMLSWAALTKRAAEQAVAAAEQAGQLPHARLVALAAMSEAELIDIRRNNMWQPKTKRPTLAMRLVEAEHRFALAKQQVQRADQETQDARADAAAARVEAQKAAEGAKEARDRVRAATAELMRKELQRTAERHDALAELERMGNEVAQARAFETAARAEAKESAAATAAAKEREVAALDKFARQAAQLAGAQRKLETALHKSQSAEEKLRAELDQVRADASTQLAAAVEHSSAAEQRAEERLAERAADRRESQVEMERLRGEIVRIRSDAETEVAAAVERTKAAENRALQRMSERAADRAAARETIDKLQSYIEQIRLSADEEVNSAREQAVLAMASVRSDTEKILAQVRAETKTQIEQAVQARAHAEAVANSYRAQIESVTAARSRGMAIPIPTSVLRPATRRIEDVLLRLHQINYILEVGMAQEVEAEIPLDAELVASMCRTVQRQADDLRREFAELPSRFNTDAHIQAAAEYAESASEACRDFLRRIGSAAEQLRHRDAGPSAGIFEAVRRLLGDSRVQQLISARVET